MAPITVEPCGIHTFPFSAPFSAALFSAAINFSLSEKEQGRKGILADTVQLSGSVWAGFIFLSKINSSEFHRSPNLPSFYCLNCTTCIFVRKKRHRERAHISCHSDPDYVLNRGRCESRMRMDISPYLVFRNTLFNKPFSCYLLSLMSFYTR